MAENVTTVLDLKEIQASETDGSEKLYIVKGSGEDRDRQISLNEVKNKIGHEVLVDGSEYDYPGDLSHKMNRMPGAGDIIFSAETTKTGRVIAGTIQEKSVTSEKLATNLELDTNLIQANEIRGKNEYMGLNGVPYLTTIFKSWIDIGGYKNFILGQELGTGYFIKTADTLNINGTLLKNSDEAQIGSYLRSNTIVGSREIKSPVFVASHSDLQTETTITPNLIEMKPEKIEGYTEETLKIRAHRRRTNPGGAFLEISWDGTVWYPIQTGVGVTYDE